MENTEEFYKQASNTTDEDVVCKNCGNHLKFKPGEDVLVCPSCNTKNEIVQDEVIIKENDFYAILDNLEEKSNHLEVHTVNCKSCGGNTTLSENQTSASCPYCGGNLIVSSQETHNVIKPEYILPFKIDENTAFSKFKNWIGSLWWAPSELNKLAKQHERFNGVYYPFWTYDSNTVSRYIGMRGTDYYETEHYTEQDDNGNSISKTRKVTKTQWVHVNGTVQNTFDDVLVVASDSLPREYVDKLDPWDLHDLKEYNDKYVAGFKTETYFIDVKDGFKFAKTNMEEIIENSVEKDIGGDRQKIVSMDVDYNDITFKHILLPIWISSYKYKNKIYRFIINGRTGEVQAERPYSWIKIALAILGGISVLAILYLIFGK